MLVLSRKQNEWIDIVKDGQVVASVLVIELRGDKSRLGVEAGKEVEIYRREVWSAICREGKRHQPQPPPAESGYGGLTFTIPAPLEAPFESGQIVEVCDRNLDVMEIVAIAQAGTQIVRLEDGRRFRATDGWWLGEKKQAWPFPSIRHKAETKGGDL